MEDKEISTKGKPHKGVYILPNLLTTAGLFGGFFAIVSCINGDYEFAAIAIILAGFFDGLDGRVARMTNTTSEFGMEYDSLADVIAFALAPGILAFTWGLSDYGRYGWLAAFMFTVCGALRLARFNVQKNTTEKNRFHGLPSPMAAGTVASTVLFFSYLGETGTVKHITILLMVFALAVLMVSNVRYYSFKDMGGDNRMPFISLVLLIIVFMLVIAEPYLMLFIIAVLYASSGLLLTLFDKKRTFIDKVKGFSEEVRDKENTDEDQ